MIAQEKWIGNLPIFIHFCMFDLQKVDENAVRCQGYPPSDLPSWEEATIGRRSLKMGGFQGLKIHKNWDTLKGNQP